jgi:hypothetical protein
MTSGASATRTARPTREASREDVIDDLLTGQFNNPLRVIAFNTAEGWSRDISEDMAWELTRRVRSDQKPLTAPTRAFVEFHIGEDELLQLKLASSDQSSASRVQMQNIHRKVN